MAKTQTREERDNNPINIEEFKDQLDVLDHTGEPLMVYGRSGIGKTRIPVWYAKNRTEKREVWVFNGCDKSPVEIVGYGVPGEDDGKNLVMRFSLPELIPALQRVGDKEIWWELDEFGNWAPENRATFHPVLAASDGEKRMLGSHVIGPNVKVLATSNRRVDGGAVGRFSIPETARFTQCTLQPDPAGWVDWADRIPAYADTHVPAFISTGVAVGEEISCRNHFCGDPKDFCPTNPNALPNPRNWEVVMGTIIGQMKGKYSKHAAEKTVIGRVGEEAALAALAFLSTLEKLPSVDEMKRNPSGYGLPDKKSEQFLLASAALTSAKLGIRDVHAAVHKGAFDWIIEGVQRLSPEVAAYAFTSAVRRGIKVDERAPDAYRNIVEM